MCKGGRPKICEQGGAYLRNEEIEIITSTHEKLTDEADEEKSFTI